MSSNTHHVYCHALKQRLTPCSSLSIDASISHACVAAIIRLNPAAQRSPPPLDLLFIRRALRSDDPWSGQIAFPGGRHQGSESLQCTAERESREEIGLDLSQSSNDFVCVGCAHQMDVTRGTHTLRVIALMFVQRTRETPPLRLAGDEVHSVAWVSTAQLMAPPLRRAEIAMSAATEARWRGRVSAESWSELMMDAQLNAKLDAVSEDVGTPHVDLCLEFRHRVVPNHVFRFPGIVLDTFTQERHWLLWGLTYRMTAHVMNALGVAHYLRFKQSSKGRYGLAHGMLAIARKFMHVDLKWTSCGLEPYFARKKLTSKL